MIRKGRETTVGCLAFFKFQVLSQLIENRGQTYATFEFQIKREKERSNYM